MAPKNRGQESGTIVQVQTLDNERAGVGVSVWRSREEQDGSQYGWDEKPTNRKERGQEVEGEWSHGNPAAVRCAECLKMVESGCNVGVLLKHANKGTCRQEDP